MAKLFDDFLRKLETTGEDKKNELFELLKSNKLSEDVRGFVDSQTTATAVEQPSLEVGEAPKVRKKLIDRLLDLNIDRKVITQNSGAWARNVDEYLETINKPGLPSALLKNTNKLQQTVVTSNVKKAPPQPPPPSYLSKKMVLERIKEIKQINQMMLYEKDKMVKNDDALDATVSKKNDAVKKYEESCKKIESALQEAEKSQIRFNQSSTSEDKKKYGGTIDQNLIISLQEQANSKQYLNQINEAQEEITAFSRLPDILQQGMKKVEKMILAIETTAKAVNKLNSTKNAGDDVTKQIQEKKATVANSLTQANAEFEELKKLSLKVGQMQPADLKKIVEERVNKVSDLKGTVLEASAEANDLANLDHYIIQKYKEAEESHRNTEDALTTAKKDTPWPSDLIWLGTKMRKDALKSKEKIKDTQERFNKAEIELKKWGKAKIAYEIEQKNIQNQQLIVDQLEKELEALKALHSLSSADQADIEQNKAELARAKALIKGSESAIDSLMRSFGGTTTSRRTTTLVLARGGDTFGFHSQVVKSVDVPQVLKNLNIQAADTPAVIVKDQTDQSLYYLNTPVENSEVIMSTKTYAPGVHACIIQSKDAIVVRSTKRIADSAHQDDIAMETALKLILRQNNSIPLDGSDRDLIQKIHATLLWMKYLPKHDLETLLPNREWSKQSSLDISKLKIISAAPGPEAAGWFKTQQGQDEAFIKSFMPGLSSNCPFKTRLMEMKAPHKTLKDPKDTQEIFGPVVGKKS